MAKNLVIVESPAKAKTIEGFLGKDFLVKSSFGHIRDLPNKTLAVDLEKEFAPNYVIPSEKKKVVDELKKLSKGAEMVWLASDEDREGEAISWHLKEALGLKQDKIKRIVFHEITKKAILRAIETPRDIDMNLVDAQQARRVLDRLVGYELSPVLWKKVKPSLSAGRVQSVAVRLIVEREREIQNFESVATFKVVAIFTLDGGAELKAELNKRIPTKEEAVAFLEQCKEKVFDVINLEVKPGKKSPAAPFTTSTLQQEASRKLGFSVSQTMTLAQRLYEAGKITYMRTDSVNLSDDAVAAAKNEIISQFGEKYLETRSYKTKSKGAQEAHEAIRPTYMNTMSAGADSAQQRLYELIWKRTIASQMSNAQLERTVVTIENGEVDGTFVAKGEVLKFDGFLKVYLESTDEDQESSESSGMLPPINIGQQLPYREIQAGQKFSSPAARYTEASLVRKLENLGIGRPSTYAPTISTVQKRGYVEKEDRDAKQREAIYLTLKGSDIANEVRKENYGAEKKKMFPTDIGMVVTDFLVDNFSDVLEYRFTAQVEEQFDEIAEGLKKWSEMIAGFYTPFHKAVSETMEHAERAIGERILGEDPKTKKTILVRIGRFGPMVQMGNAEDEEKPRYASLLKGQSVETITLEEALKLFELPRTLGEYKEKEVVVAVGRYGPYVRYDGLFASLDVKEGDDPMTITMERAQVLIDEKVKAEAEKYIKTFKEDPTVQVLKGKYGPYIKIVRKNFKIPKDVDPTELTLEACKKIAEEAGTKTKKKKKK